MGTRPISSSSSPFEFVDRRNHVEERFLLLGERLQQIFSDVFWHSEASTRSPVSNPPSKEEKKIIDWCEKRTSYLSKNPDLTQDSDICQITQLPIYDKAQLISENGIPVVFERSALLHWLVKFSKTNPVTRQAVGDETIRAIFSEAKDPIPFCKKDCRVITVAARGNLDELKKYFPDRRHLVDQLHNVSQNGDLFSPLQYAVSSNQWAVVAYLLNQGIDWSLISTPANGRTGKTAVSMLEKKPQGLLKIVEQLVLCKEPIDVEPLVFLVTSKEISVNSRREILSRPDLCHDLAGRLKKDEALLVMCALMTGSYQFKGAHQTDFHRLLYQNSRLGYSDTIGNDQMLLFASILSGLKSFKEIIDLTFAKCSKLTEQEKRSLSDHNILPREKIKILRKMNKELSECYGLNERSTENEYLSEDPSVPKVQVFGVENTGNFMWHYGLLFRSTKGNYVIHIGFFTQNMVVCFDKAEDVFTEVRKDPGYKAIYTFMLPWHMS